MLVLVGIDLPLRIPFYYLQNRLQGQYSIQGKKGCQGLVGVSSSCFSLQIDALTLRRAGRHATCHWNVWNVR